jgi:hypothetical protein
MKQRLTYFVSASNEIGYAYQVTAQRGDKSPELNSRFPRQEQLNEAIGLATRLAIAAKHDYGNSDVRLVIQPAICSIDEPMIKI